MEILLISLILFLAFFAINLSNRMGIPSLMVFILIGLVFSYLGFEFRDFDQALNFATFALVIISFYSGLALNLDSVKTSYRESLLMSTLGVIITAGAIAVFAYLVLGLSMVEGILLGSIVGSTDAAGIFSMLRGKGLNLKYDTNPMISLESGANDTFSKSLTFAFTASFGQSWEVTGLELIRLVGLGILIGLAVAKLAQISLRVLKIRDDWMNTLFLLTGVLFTYGLSEVFGANQFLSVYILGLYMGNKTKAARRESVLFFEEASDLMTIGYFFLLGVFLVPIDFIKALPYAALLIAFITLVARPLATFLILKPFNRPADQIKFVSFAGFRGSTAIILALKSTHLPLSFDLLHVVFGVVVLSFLIQNLGLERLAHKLDMIDPETPIHKTFNDYLFETDLGFLQGKIRPGSSWEGRSIADINMEDNFLVSTIIRDDEMVIPHGDTVFEEGDIIVIGGQAYHDDQTYLDEITLSEQNDWIGYPIKDLGFQKDETIIGLIRDGHIIIPSGSTVLEENDHIILTKKE